MNSNDHPVCNLVPCNICKYNKIEKPYVPLSVLLYHSLADEDYRMTDITLYP